MNGAHRPDRAAGLKPRTRAKPTQNERLLAHALKGEPLEQDQWWRETPDGGPAIRGLRSRIAELERRGFLFEHITRPGRLAEYRLLAEPCDAASKDASVGALDDQLPLLSTDRARVGHYDCWDG